MGVGRYRKAVRFRRMVGRRSGLSSRKDMTYPDPLPNSSRLSDKVEGCPVLSTRLPIDELSPVGTQDPVTIIGT